ncbi:hypothetical protein BpHYR1_003094 [Brachionus plicatilis]|uniref:Uncharacterized protein n=1 Tax=Brachionus plicatilis TaxID=10195 RepID=A0A3M7PNZ9_BRAPC|nr:hypothetical protein BpHYR1_003094 [Brachionus plicatilis]
MNSKKFILFGRFKKFCQMTRTEKMSKSNQTQQHRNLKYSVYVDDQLDELTSNLDRPLLLANLLSINLNYSFYSFEAKYDLMIRIISVGKRNGGGISDVIFKNNGSKTLILQPNFLKKHLIFEFYFDFHFKILPHFIKKEIKFFLTKNLIFLPQAFWSDFTES